MPGKIKYLLFSVLIIIGLPILIMILQVDLLSHVFWKNKPFHSFIETIGGMVAIFLAVVLLIRKNENYQEEIYLMSLGFVCMGILDCFHAASFLGQKFVYFHSTASFFGGFFFALIYFPKFGKYLSANKFIIRGIILFPILFGMYILFFPEIIPDMINNGSFTSSALILNFISGIFFLLASIRLITIYYRSGDDEIFLFIHLALLFAVSGFIFEISSLWDFGWWFWHILRFLAYLIVLTIVARQYMFITSSLKKNKEKYQNAVQNLFEGFYSSTIDGTFLMYNDQFIKLLGLDPDKNYIGKKIPDLWHNPDDRADYIDKLMKNDYVKREVIKAKTYNGDIIHLQVNAQLIKDQDGTPLRIEGTFLDISAQLAAEKKLKEILKFRDKILSESPVGITIYNAVSGQCIAGNNSMAKIIGTTEDELLKQNYLNIGSWKRSGMLNKAKNAISNNLNEQCEVKVITTFGKDLYVDCHFAPFLAGSQRYLLLTVTDITKRKKAEEEKVKLESQLQQAQKMEAIGTLAGGIAHDFNNILSVIMGYTELTKDDLSNTKKVIKNLQHVMNASERAKTMVQQILTFSRKSDQKIGSVNVAKIISEMISFLQSSIPSTIEIRSDIEKDSGLIYGNDTQINQILMNLCTNASFAMKEEGGLLNIELKKIILGPGDIESLDLRSGTYQLLTVSDTGTGISGDIIDRIFEPYFTTKKTGEGTGMGLAVIYGIIKSYGGEIKVNSELGKGTAFNVYIPSLETVETDRTQIDDQPYVTGNNEKILFVDDEKPLAELGTQILTGLEYQVDSRTNSIEALEIFKADPDKYDLIITDMTMPNMTGVKLAEEIHKLRPDIPVILCTGFSSIINKNNYKSQGINAMIMKPIIKRELSETIRRVLDNLKKV